MKTSRWSWAPWIGAVALTLLALGLAQHHARTVRLKVERKDVWMRYLHGPLADLLYGSSRLRPLVLKKKLSAKEEAEAREAGQSLERSRFVVPRLRAQLLGDTAMLGFDDVVTWHQEIGSLMEPWPGMINKGLGRQALAVEADLRHRLWQALDALRQTMMADGTLSEDEVLEMNAMLYSLKEDTEPAAVAGKR